MTTFPQLKAFEDETSRKTLTLPLRGREYTWQQGEIPLRASLTINRVRAEAIAAAAKALAKLPDDTDEDSDRVVLTDQEEAELAVDLISPAHQAQMAADGVTLAEYNKVYSTVLAWAMWGEDHARAVWTGDDGGVVPPRRKATPKKPPGSTAAPRKSGGRTSSNGGATSKRTSTASTKST